MRAARRQNLWEPSMRCMICFTLNIPGACKQFPMARAAFDEGLAALRDLFPDGLTMLDRRDEVTGSEVLLRIDADPETVKRQTVELETLHPLGRLFDFDVYDNMLRPVSRTALGLSERTCLVCTAGAKACARSRSHDPELVHRTVAELLDRYFCSRAARICASCAGKALLIEASAAPKPGLVDRFNPGAHRDMDYFTFLASSAALLPWFEEMFIYGWQHEEESAQELLEGLRFLGREAERVMLRSTAGVNTHKGLVFSLGLLCGALGKTLGENPCEWRSQRVTALCAEMGRWAMDGYLIPAGLAAGARGEAAAGFSTARAVGVPVLQKWLKTGCSLNDAAVAALLALMSRTDDTNLLRRAGRETAERWRLEFACAEHSLTPENLHALAEELDTKLTAANLSPGGSADLLCISLMLMFLEQEKESILIQKSQKEEDNVSI